MMKYALIVALALLLATPHLHPQACGCVAPSQVQDGAMPDAPPRAPGEGQGPFDILVLHGVMLVDGTGAPPRGPVDIRIEKNRIVSIINAGNPGMPLPEAKVTTEPDRRVNILDLEGQWVLPGFVDMHGHIGGKEQGAFAEYVFKLWMGHGITTIRDPACGNGLDWVLRHKKKSAENLIVAPRILAYPVFGQGHESPFTSPQEAMQWVDQIVTKGADGAKFFGYRPDIMRAAVSYLKQKGLRSACHHAQLDVARVNVVDTARWGLTSMEHWYGLPEALFTDRTVQDYPVDYNYNDEQNRFEEAGRLWEQAAKPGSKKWNEVMKTLLDLDFTIDPTFNIYEASRDLMRLRCAEWHPLYTLPSLWDFFQPSRKAHGSYWFDWGTEQEVAWKRNYRLWMRFVNEYKNRGGRVTAGSDSGYIFQTYGFGYIRELELLREAGFHPLEVIRSATLYGAQALGMDDEVGSIEPGKLADMIVVPLNPLANLKVLYATGAIHLDENNRPVRVGGVRYTIKDGIVYDAARLREDVRRMVKQAWSSASRTLRQPGR